MLLYTGERCNVDRATIASWLRRNARALPVLLGSYAGATATDLCGRMLLLTPISVPGLLIVGT